VAGDKSTAAAAGAWICFEDETGTGQQPAKARTWGRRGRTPVVKVTLGGKGKVMVAGLTCYRPGSDSRLMFRTRLWHGRRGEQPSFTEHDFAALLDTAHQRLHAPIVLVWDNLARHRSARMRALIDARPWLTVHRLPPYAPDLNPTEGIWSSLKSGLGNLTTAHTTIDAIDEITALVKTRLRHMQHRTDHLIDGCLAATGLTLEPD
jgi:DDE superfamily endonuclease